MGTRTSDDGDGAGGVAAPAPYAPAPCTTAPCAAGPAGQLSSSSGHSMCRKARFAATFSATYIPLTLATIAKDFYVEKLGAEPIVIGILFFFVSFCSVVNDALSGALQNNEALRRLFPVRTWGRKAPWLYTHMVLLACACFMLGIPPRDPYVLHIWFLVVLIATYWGISTCIIAFESCRQELFPYNEERANVEVYTKFACAFGIVYGALPSLVLLAYSTFLLRLCASAVYAVGILGLGLQAKPTWLEAKSVNVQERRQNLLRDSRETWGNDAFRHLCAVRLYDGVHQGITVTNLIYYVTYICEMYGKNRSFFVVGTGAFAIASDMGTALIVGKAMRKRENSFRVQGFVAVCRLTNTIFTVAIAILAAYVGDSGLNSFFFGVWLVGSRVLQSPFTFWRVGAQCWIVDEDIQSSGTRREAAFFSVASACQNFSRAFASAFCFMGYGLAGLRPLDCETECGSHSSEDCFNDCMSRSIAGQPATLRWYVQLLLMAGLAAVELPLVYHVWVFPISGIRLAKLYNNQTLACGGEVDAGSATAQMRKLKKQRSLQDIVDHQRGDAVLVVNDPNDHIEMDRLRSPKNRDKVSASVLYAGTLAEFCDTGNWPYGDNAVVGKETSVRSVHFADPSCLADYLESTATGHRVPCSPTTSAEAPDRSCLRKSDADSDPPML